MSEHVLVLGGARSGKSSLAERSLADAGAVDYVATSAPAPDDPEWVARVAAHRARRPASWQTIETLDIASVLAGPGPAVLVDCIGVWLTRMFDAAGVWTEDGVREPSDPCWQVVDDAVDALVDAVSASPREVWLVSNEVGLGVVPPFPSGRVFQDRLGIVNMRLAAACDRVVLCVAGIPLTVKAP